MLRDSRMQTGIKPQTLPYLLVKSLTSGAPDGPPAAATQH